MMELSGGGDGATCGCGSMARVLAARLAGLRPAIGSGTPRGDLGGSAVLAERRRKTGWRWVVVSCRSRAGAKVGRRARLIREKIIGHDLRGFAPAVRHRGAISAGGGSQAGLALL